MLRIALGVRRLLLLAVPLGFAAVLACTTASGQQAPQESAPADNIANPTQAMTPPGGDSGAQPFEFRRILTRFEFWLSLLILAFGAIVIGVEFALLKTMKFDGNDILKVFGVTLIVVGTLFLIAAGFGDKQIAPAMGLFGTLAGYLLGRAATTRKNAEE